MSQPHSPLVCTEVREASSAPGTAAVSRRMAMQELEEENRRLLDLVGFKDEAVLAQRSINSSQVDNISMLQEENEALRMKQDDDACLRCGDHGN